MDSVSAALLIGALDGLSARAEVTAENIANGGTPGYRPLRVTFEAALAAAAAKGDPTAIKAVTPRIERQRQAVGEEPGLRLDLELATASGTAARYGALAEILNHRLQLDALAASEIR